MGGCFHWCGPLAADPVRSERVSTTRWGFFLLACHWRPRASFSFLFSSFFHSKVGGVFPESWRWKTNSHPRLNTFESFAHRIEDSSEIPAGGGFLSGLRAFPGDQQLSVYSQTFNNNSLSTASSQSRMNLLDGAAERSSSVAGGSTDIARHETLLMDPEAGSFVQRRGSRSLSIGQSLCCACLLGRRCTMYPHPHSMSAL